MIRHLKTFVILFMFLMPISGVLAKNADYVFDPLDPHHSLYIPETTTKAPAILLLHASTGIEKVNYDWASRLRDRGYVVYIIDSFKPRGWEDRRSVGWEKATQAQLDDVDPAYQYLKQLPFVDPDRIGILGFSMGGFDVLKVMEAPQHDPAPYQKLPFKAAASFYGVCHRLDANAKLRAITKIFIGEYDDRATTNDCIDLVNRSLDEDLDISIQIYPGALHGFDNFEFPDSKEIIDEKGELYHIGFSKPAREEALKDLPAFFDRFLKA
ncbi:Predicted dienelactone hydrolase [Legionella steigerwaltii]|uniref:Dienelactone hydrolase family protein n=1 Tax=Legionella steigerwaltii TaxID=460 RepID=A0A378LCH7_9GAMM|nr:dienelactone hydrolase family protein [Legionella steigerwaltii]KTD79549.1 Dienelactone hydrolase family protein [Legionella steigerwaltii]STY24566.1 Predicted dienelactone hydrolase [Legionella steigerwaltii]